jgi:hypothetical protein
MSLKVHALKRKQLCSKTFNYHVSRTSNEKSQQTLHPTNEKQINLDTYLGVVYQYLLIMKKLLIFNKYNGLIIDNLSILNLVENWLKSLFL